MTSARCVFKWSEDGATALPCESVIRVKLFVRLNIHHFGQLHLSLRRFVEQLVFEYNLVGCLRLASLACSRDCALTRLDFCSVAISTGLFVFMHASFDAWLFKHLLDIFIVLLLTDVGFTFILLLSRLHYVHGSGLSYLNSSNRTASHDYRWLCLLLKLSLWLL